VYVSRPSPKPLAYGEATGDGKITGGELDAWVASSPS